VVMRHRWAKLLFLHWIVPVEALRPLIPSELEIDTFDGNAYVGLVPFTMPEIRPMWMPAMGPLTRFHEVNVRTYVHHRGRDPGVWFFSLDAAKPMAVWLARTIWSLPYHWARMQIEPSTDGSTRYHSSRRANSAGCEVVYRPIGEPKASTLGSLEHFLAERYVLYSQSSRGLFRGRVHHSPYPLQPAEVIIFKESLLAANNIQRPDSAPLAHYASEVRVNVYPLEKVG